MNRIFWLLVIAACLAFSDDYSRAQVVGLHLGSQHTNDPHGSVSSFERNGEIDAAITQTEEAHG